ncbi:MAG TPA: 2-oxo-4-hydroxy-4-carboxy-5-ureidoimidazoline decarboxylase [Candidatus Acidoferrales bacterium]|jgi:2-oxo-4-hydroxy-4-carboxy-5-ureidoimidazoline decarboxylase|nr:2-oxo-4-hydroxy-4-carboxy-5-ureidoimidazoline decarboxylase [Candidatus Acidoferrales bacterium]
MTLADFNALPSNQAVSLLMDCCGSTRWVATIAARRPYADPEELHKTADSVWWKLDRADWLEAFSHHPQIGDKPASGSESARQWAEGEQNGARIASDDVKTRLARANRAYFEKFGYIYIVCATGKTAEGMLAILNQRLQNDQASELSIAAEQQRLITRIRLQKLLAGEDRSS